MERHEIPAQQVKRLKELRDKQENAGAAVIRAKAVLYDAVEHHKSILGQLGAAASSVADLLDIDQSRPFTLTADCTAFEVGDPK